MSIGTGRKRPDAHDLNASCASGLLLVFLLLAVPRWRKAFCRSAPKTGKRTQRRLQRCAPAVLERQRRSALNLHAAIITCCRVLWITQSCVLWWSCLTAAAPNPWLLVSAWRCTSAADVHLVCALAAAMLRLLQPPPEEVWRTWCESARQHLDPATVMAIWSVATTTGPRAAFAIGVLFLRLAHVHCRSRLRCRAASACATLLLTFKEPAWCCLACLAAWRWPAFGKGPPAARKQGPGAKFVDTLRCLFPRAWGDLIIEELGREYGLNTAHRMLEADWSAAWGGWTELAAELNLADEQGNFWDVATSSTHNVLRRFLRLAVANRNVTVLSDQARQAELRTVFHLVRGQGRVYGRSDCLADSLLQLLAAKDFLPTFTVSARNEACRRNRMALCTHANADLRPKLRDPNTNAVLSEDGGAFLQHDIHAEATVQFFMRHFAAKVLRALPECGLRVRVFTRMDSETIPPSTVDICRCSEQRGQPVDLDLYNLTGEEAAGYHYDPMFVAQDRGDKTSWTADEKLAAAS